MRFMVPPPLLTSQHRLHNPKFLILSQPSAQSNGRQQYISVEGFRKGTEGWYMSFIFVKVFLPTRMSLHDHSQRGWESRPNENSCMVKMNSLIY